MSVWSFVTSLISPVTKLIDGLHTSDHERLQVKAELFAMQSAMAEKVMAYEMQLLKAQSQVITAEANGQSWLQRTWRPITMLTFLALVVCDSFGLLAFRLASEAWTLLQLGLGGYVVGRSVEKIIPKLTQVIKN